MTSYEIIDLGYTGFRVLIKNMGFHNDGLGFLDFDHYVLRFSLYTFVL